MQHVEELLSELRSYVHSYYAMLSMAVRNGSCCELTRCLVQNIVCEGIKQAGI